MTARSQPPLFDDVIDLREEKAKAILSSILPNTEIRPVPGNPNIIGGYLFVAGLMTYMVLPSGLVINCFSGEAVNDIHEADPHPIIKPS